jgi:hypothetical protein
MMGVIIYIMGVMIATSPLQIEVKFMITLTISTNLTDLQAVGLSLMVPGL